jgi:hypothetical protein
MQAATQRAPAKKSKTWSGWILTGLCALFLFVDGAVKVIQIAAVREAMDRLGYPQSVTVGIGILLIVCTTAYVIPRTSVLGAVLLTGYLGGATTTHVRVGDPFWFPILLGALVWTGLLLRDARLREIFPLER